MKLNSGSRTDRRCLLPRVLSTQGPASVRDAKLRGSSSSFPVRAEQVLANIHAGLSISATCSFSALLGEMENTERPPNHRG
jgi:hypothetical protein